MNTTVSMTLFRALFHRTAVFTGASFLTLSCFMVLPVIQAIGKPPMRDLTVQGMDTTNIPPPPPPPEEEIEDEPEPEEEPPELIEETQPLDLTQLELMLNPGIGDGLLGGDFTLSLDNVSAAQKVEDLFSLADLDQKPRALYQASPILNAKLRKKAPGKVYILFVVNAEGRVEDPRVKSSSDPVFERAALAAVKKWKFEPGKRQGKAVRFLMKVPITFPKQ